MEWTLNSSLKRSSRGERRGLTLCWPLFPYCHHLWMPLRSLSSTQVKAFCSRSKGLEISFSSLVYFSNGFMSTPKYCFISGLTLSTRTEHHISEVIKSLWQLYYANGNYSSIPCLPSPKHLVGLPGVCFGMSQWILKHKNIQIHSFL